VHRYIGDRFLPDKAIDLVDEAASRLRIEIDSLPQEIDEVERRSCNTRFELAALAKEKDKASKERRAKVEQELAELRERSKVMKAQWQAEKDAITGLQAKKAQLEQLRAEAEQATRRGDLQKAAEISYGRIPALEREIAEAEKRLAQIQKKGKYLKEEVDAEDIAEIVRQVDGDPGHEDARIGARAAHTARSGARAARGRTTGGARRRRQRGAPGARGAAGSQPANRSFIFLGPRAWGRRRPPARSRSSCSTMKRRSCGSTCRSTWRNTPSRA